MAIDPTRETSGLKIGTREEWLLAREALLAREEERFDGRSRIATTSWPLLSYTG